MPPILLDIPGSYAVGIRARWAGMDTHSVGVPLSRTEYPKRTVQVTGELVDGDLEGTQTPEDEASWMVLLDDVTRDRLTRPGLYRVTMNPLAIRPIVREGAHVAFDLVATR